MRDDEQAKMREEVFLRELKEDLKRENMKQFWKKYGGLFAALAVLAVAGTGAFEFYRSWSAQVAAEDSQQYQTALDALSSDKPADARLLFDYVAKNARTGFSGLAMLQEAVSLKKEGKAAEANERLKQLAADPGLAPELREVAAVSLAYASVDSAPAEEVKALVAPFSGSASPWYGSYLEIEALLALRAGDKEGLKALLARIEADEEIPPSLKARALDLARRIP